MSRHILIGYMYNYDKSSIDWNETNADPIAEC